MRELVEIPMSHDPESFDELPELTLSLRSLGSRRHASLHEGTVEQQERYFAPFLESRRRAASATERATVLAAFDARRLLAAVDATLRAFASQRFGDRPPARRAFEAELFEIAEPVREALQLLGARARDLESSTAGGQDASEPWRSWLGQLRVTFRVADASWPPLRTALENAALPPAPARTGWRPFQRKRGSK